MLERNAVKVARCVLMGAGLGDETRLPDIGGKKMKNVNVGVIGLGHNGMSFCERYAKKS